MSDKKRFELENIDIAWCPGCGNFGLRNILMKALAELNLEPKQVVIVSGIGQAAKMPHYVKTHCFNGLHGRHLPVATAIKVCNPELVVLSESGDGCTYGEGGNHFMQTIRRNPNITNIVHNNMVYGLTKGQASPTTECGFKTPVQVGGVILEPFNPISVAIALDASFVARTFVGNMEHAVSIVKEAINHRGYALVDIFQPCVTFNKKNTFKWFRDNTYVIEDDYDPTNKEAAFQKALEKDKLPLGVIYKNVNKNTYEENMFAYIGDQPPFYQKKVDQQKLQSLIKSKK